MNKKALGSYLQKQDYLEHIDMKYVYNAYFISYSDKYALDQSKNHSQTLKILLYFFKKDPQEINKLLDIFKQRADELNDSSFVASAIDVGRLLSSFSSSYQYLKNFDTKDKFYETLSFIKFMEDHEYFKTYPEAYLKLLREFFHGMMTIKDFNVDRKYLSNDEYDVIKKFDQYFKDKIDFTNSISGNYYLYIATNLYSDYVFNCFYQKDYNLCSLENWDKIARTPYFINYVKELCNQKIFNDDLYLRLVQTINNFVLTYNNQELKLIKQLLHEVTQFSDFSNKVKTSFDEKLFKGFYEVHSFSFNSGFSLVSSSHQVQWIHSYFNNKVYSQLLIKHLGKGSSGIILEFSPIDKFVFSIDDFTKYSHLFDDSLKDIEIKYKSQWANKMKLVSDCPSELLFDTIRKYTSRMIILDSL